MKKKTNKSLIKETLVNENTLKSNKSTLTIFHNTWLHLAVITLIIIIIYSPSLNANFIWDDHQIIKSPAVFDVENVFRHKDTPSMNQKFTLYLSRPVAMFTFVLNHKIHEYNITGYHIFNTSVHVFTAFLVYSLTVLILRSEFFFESILYKNRFIIAFATAVIFAVHPIQTLAISYLSQRFASLATFFYLASLNLYILSRYSWIKKDNNKVVIYYILAIISVILAYKTKEIAYTLPFACMICEFLFFKGDIKRRFLFLIPIFITLIVFPITLYLIDKYSVISSSEAYKSLRATGIHQDMPRLQYFFTELVVLVRYLGLLFLPINQSIYHDYTIYESFFNLPVFLSFSLFAGLIVFLILKTIKTPDKTHYRIILFGFLWFLLTLSVESSFIPLYPMYEHRLYLPSFGIFFACISTITLFALKQNSAFLYKTLISLTIIVILILSISSYNRNEIYKNDVALWESELEKTKFKNTPHVIITNLGLAYFRAGEYDKAINLYNRIIGITPHQDEVYNTLGVIYLKTKQYEKAIDSFNKALEINPQMPESLVGLGQTYLETGRIKEATQKLEEGKKGMYPHYMLLTLLGEVYIRQNRIDDAIDAFERAIKLKPDFISVYIRLSSLYKNKKLYEKAEQMLITALKYSPNNLEIIQKLKELSQ